MSNNIVDLEKNRHSMAHVLAQAIIRLFPGAKIGLGPVVGEYFYYEVETEPRIQEEDFPRIEEEMWSIVKANYPMTQVIVSKEEAYNLLLHQGQIYKTEILEEINDPQVSIYKTGEEFLDLDSGPHVASTAHIGFFKLTKLEEVHWRGKPDRPKMQRVWGVGFLTKKDLMNYLEKQKKLKENDHMKIGPKLNLFYFSKNAGNGLPIWLPKGVVVKQALMKFIDDKLEDEGFKEVSSPPILPAKSSLIETLSSDNKDLLFPELVDDKERFLLRTDINPHHYEIYNSKTRGYKELPYRIFENSIVFRNEVDDSYSGLTRSRVFTSQRLNIFCNEDQIFNELVKLFTLSKTILDTIGITDYKIQLTTNSSTNDKRFRWADQVLRKVIEHLKLFTRQLDDQTTENGPKIEIFVKDIFDKEWQLSSIQLDIFSTVKQSLQYIDPNNTPREAIAIHATLIGSYERLLALMIEKYGGNLPVWISPVHARVLPISKIYNSYGEKIVKELKEKGLRVDIDSNDETLQNKIRISQEEKIPFMLIVGSKEESSNSISVRPREDVDLGLMKTEEFIDHYKKTIDEELEID